MILRILCGDDWEWGRGKCSEDISILNVSRFFLFITKGAYFLAYPTLILYFQNSLGLIVITNLFSKYGLIIVHMPAAKKNQGWLEKQLENEIISSSLHPVFLWSPVQLPLSQIPSPQFIVPCHFFFCLLFCPDSKVRQCNQSSFPWVNQFPSSSAILINATQ